MTKWEMWRRACLAHAQLRRMQKKIDSANQLLDRYFDLVTFTQVAYSTGKDSTVMLDLIAQRNEPFKATFTDHHWEMPGTVEMLETAASYYGIHVYTVRRTDDWEPKWVKEFDNYPVPPAIQRSVDYVGLTRKSIIQHFGFDGVCVGLRRQESTKRLFATQEPLRWNKATEVWHADPIYNWTHEDVFGYIFIRDLPIHPAYEALINAGVPPQYARVGPLTATEVYQYGTMTTIKQLWPDTWNEFAQANPCVESYG
jgi:3'-phosphoadenosine 5'-phosphosulfate sulfotransferase (PAPS reductase)/FAD synthetase